MVTMSRSPPRTPVPSLASTFSVSSTSPPLPPLPTVSVPASPRRSATSSSTISVVVLSMFPSSTSRVVSSLSRPPLVTPTWVARTSTPTSLTTSRKSSPARLEKNPSNLLRQKIITIVESTTKSRSPRLFIATSNNHNLGSCYSISPGLASMSKHTSTRFFGRFFLLSPVFLSFFLSLVSYPALVSSTFSNLSIARPSPTLNLFPTSLPSIPGVFMFKSFEKPVEKLFCTLDLEPLPKAFVAGCPTMSKEYFYRSASMTLCGMVTRSSIELFLSTVPSHRLERSQLFVLQCSLLRLLSHASSPPCAIAIPPTAFQTSCLGTNTFSTTMVCAHIPLLSTPSLAISTCQNKSWKKWPKSLKRKIESISNSTDSSNATILPMNSRLLKRPRTKHTNQNCRLNNSSLSSPSSTPAVLVEWTAVTTPTSKYILRLRVILRLSMDFPPAAVLTRSSLLVVPPVFPASRSSFPTSSTARSSRRASTPMRLLPTVPPSRPVSSLERPPLPTPPTSSSSMSALSPSVLPWRVTSSPPSFPAVPPFPPSRSVPSPPSPTARLPYNSLFIKESVPSAPTTPVLVNSLLLPSPTCAPVRPFSSVSSRSTSTVF
ncbi:unnamed protein product [Aureobasidium pullulans]|nr:unnamed protein product [Aureobasidium pullulans]